MNNEESYPDRKQAIKLLIDAEKCNPGPWGRHSIVTAQCAEKIAGKCGMNAEKAYILGLLHDIGRRYGKYHFRHISGGYYYMKELGYDTAARICLTHSFPTHSFREYIGNFDDTQEVTEELQSILAGICYDDYDSLIQLCDSLAGAEGVVSMEERMNDIKKRYGAYPVEKKEANRQLKQYFDDKCGEDVYQVIKGL